MNVFLSYSHADKALAAKLRKGLEEEGLSVHEPGESFGPSWRQQIEQAIRSTDAILLLLSYHKQVDEHQQLTWRLALQAVWENPAKRWIPLLLGDAKLPAFVRSGASGDKVEAIRIRDRKDLGPAINAVLKTLSIPVKTQPENESYETAWSHSRNGSSTRRSPNASSAAFDLIEIYPAVTDEDRVRQQENFAAIQKYAEQLKHHG